MQPPSRLVTLSIAFASLLLACSPPTAGGAKPPPSITAEPLPMSDKVYPKPSDEELQKKLTPMQFAVARRNNTEPPFRNDFWDHHEAGLYVDVVSGEPLFASVHKFDSGTGWPSFTQPVEKGRVKELTDATHGMTRVEVRSRDGDSHLGHVFDDGPGPLGLRYCINSASLRFVPAAQLQAQGYERFAALFGAGAPAAPVDTAALACGPQEKSGCAATVETAVVAGGCFWGMEELLRQIPGVLETEVGYTGGALESPTYDDVKKGNTGHAEAVRITFDPSTISFEALLENWFFRMHDPTTVDRQGNDVGTQYRSAIFFASPEQKATAEKVIARVDASGKWKSKVVTRLQPFTVFTKAEDYHQDYLQKNPGGYTCHWMRD